jgi:head-tail adaptor
MLEKLRESEIGARRVAQEVVRARADVSTRRASLRSLRVTEAGVHGKLGKLRSEQAMVQQGLALVQQQSTEMAQQMDASLQHADAQMTAARELLRHGRVRAEDVERDHRILLRERKDLVADLDLLRVEEEKEFVSLAQRANMANQEVSNAASNLAKSVQEAEGLKEAAASLHRRVNVSMESVERTSREARDTADEWGRVVVSGKQNLMGGLKDIAEADARSTKVHYDEFTHECADLSAKMAAMNQDFRSLNSRLDPVVKRVDNLS